jgi:hypothetical protein
MTKSRIVLAITALAICGIFITCNKSSNPAGPTPPPDPTTGQIILSEGFEGDLSNYRALSFDSLLMSITTQNPHSGTHSLTSDSNNSSIRGILDRSIDDSIAGLQFYLMATKAGQDLMVAFCKTGSSPTGLYTIIGMGIDKSGSLTYVYQNAPDDSINNESKNFAALTLNKWYKCRIEYDYSDTTLTYYVDDKIVRQRTTPTPMSLPVFVVMRDSLGTQGPSGCYLDDITIFKR